jgi:ferrochelatase
MVNLGTPDNPTSREVRRFLGEFLSDRQVVPANPLLWGIVLNGIILPLRAPKVARLYSKIWTPSGSPLLDHSRKQCALLAERLGERYCVLLAMRYGRPSLQTTLDELCDTGCERIVLFPQFPQFSQSTTGSLCEAVTHHLSRRAKRPVLQVVPPYHVEPHYVDALAARVREAAGEAHVEHYVISFHGLPCSAVRRGDPYPEQCAATAEALAASLGLARPDWSLVFQSRVGPGRWLSPYADQAVPALAKRFRRVLITMPGFTVDCLETLEEVQIRLRRAFLEAGGTELITVPALNEHPSWLETMAHLVRITSNEGPEATSSSKPPRDAPR